MAKRSRRSQNESLATSTQTKRKRRAEGKRRPPERMDDQMTSSNKKRRARKKPKYGFSRALGILMAIVQFVLSVVFVVNVAFFDMLTTTYMMVLVAALLVILCITVLSQVFTKGRGWSGKMFCILMCIVLATCSFYVTKVNDTFKKLTGGTKQTSTMVVAVMKDDPADNIKDAKDYKFGIQYSSYKDQTQSMLTQINHATNVYVDTAEYPNLISEVDALYRGEVQAIIYNTAQTSVVQDQIKSFSDDIKIIYEQSIVVEIENTTVDTSVNEPFVVYLSGNDSYGPITDSGRSDVNILAVVNPNTHQILLVSTPRDYYIPIPEVSGGMGDKLTHAGTYGVKASMNTLAQLYGVDCELFGRINFTTLINIVDMLGGLDVKSDTTFTTGTESGDVVNVVEGMNHFNGKQALAFCRERHALAEGDHARGKHQQAVITAILKKALSPTMLTNAVDVLNSVQDGIDTNFSSEQIQTLVKGQLKSGANWDIKSVQAQGGYGNEACYSSGSVILSVVIPDYESVNSISAEIQAVLNGEMLQDSESLTE